VNINITVFVQMINFWIAYWILRVVIFRPAVTCMQAQEAEIVELMRVIALKKQSVSQTQIEQKEQWDTFRKHCKFNTPGTEHTKKGFTFKRAFNESDREIELKQIKELADQYSQRLIQFLKEDCA
jgi:uncharacterized membrane protein